MRGVVGAITAVGAAALLTGAAAATPSPVLGQTWAPYQSGYGHPHPVTVSNGGDPTGLVRQINWAHWGERVATGTGISTYVWPGTGVAANGPTPGARVVAFHLGTCRGRASYNAVEWYYPKYGESFDSHTYINACTGNFVGSQLREISCSNVPLANGRTIATHVQAIHIRCAIARQLIVSSPSTRYARAGGRFMTAGFRCGTPGAIGIGTAIFDCQHGEREFLFQIAGS